MSLNKGLLDKQIVLKGHNTKAPMTTGTRYKENLALKWA